MTLTESFNKWLARIDHAGLPWQTSKDELLDIFTAGFHAGVESTKQQDLFPGTLSSEQAPYHASCPASLTGENAALVAPKHPFKSDAGLITAEDIYAAYPRKVGKQAAVKAINKAAKRVGSLSELLSCTKAYAAATATWPAADKQFIPHPATWFNRGSYDDDPKEWVRGAAATPSQFTRKYE